ncbi:beta-1,4-galactosyltransferase galt-1-like [Genypterus blacodes]|uniref:beta-1,4-galactosyltransferase galt-1-like n=1 Tax=Genypterus blacodes TaxID=154954 RepID=UPI003F7605C7
MDKWRELRGKFFFLLLLTILVLVLVISVKPPSIHGFFPNPHRSINRHLVKISEDSITPLHQTKHMLVSAYMDQRRKSWDVRIIGIFRRDSIQPLHCLFYCEDHVSNTFTPANILQHSDNFGFPYTTTDVLCEIPKKCRATHVTLVPNKEAVKHTFLPIRNQKTNGDEAQHFDFNFTVCISSLFGDYNNVLQVAQTLEMYRLLGVNRVVIYNTSCGPELDRLLRGYSQEGFVEIVPWPIDHHLKPSHGWSFSEHGGELHYFGQLTTLNECTYRNMERSRYVLLNDIDEIIMPYKHNNLMSLMDELQLQHPKTGVFLIENHIFPKIYFEPSGKFKLPQWNGVPGINILEHIYREEPNRNVYHPHKMIVRPRAVEQTSVHEPLQIFEDRFKVPPDLCRIIHTRHVLRKELKLDQLHVDTKLWNFSGKLIPNVDKVLRRTGLLSSEGQI